MLIDSLIGSIILYDDGRIIIAFNYRDKKEEANIDEIAASAEQIGSDIAQDGSADYPAAEAVTEGLVAEVGLAPVVQADCVDKAGSAGFVGGQHRPRPGAVPEAQLEVPHG